MTLIQVVYLSTAERDISQAELEALLKVSRRKNAAADLTGLLLYHDRSIIQVLEGPADAVEATLARIGRDPRHTGIVRLIDREITEREFPDWSMGFARLGDLVESPEGHNPYLDPDFLDELPAHLGAEPGRAHQLLKSFKASRR